MRLLTFKVKKELYGEYKSVEKVKLCDIFRLALAKYVEAAKQGRGAEFMKDLESWH